MGLFAVCTHLTPKEEGREEGWASDGAKFSTGCLLNYEMQIKISSSYA
jgi:hypothetical protein